MMHPRQRRHQQRKAPETDGLSTPLREAGTAGTCFATCDRVVDRAQAIPHTSSCVLETKGPTRSVASDDAGTKHASPQTDGLGQQLGKT
jgi:hypothetical protein